VAQLTTHASLSISFIPSIVVLVRVATIAETKFSVQPKEQLSGGDTLEINAVRRVEKVQDETTGCKLTFPLTDRPLARLRLSFIGENITVMIESSTSY